MPRSGVIAIGGPPFGGRTVLAGLLADYLPRSLKLETVERLTREEFYPEGPAKPAASRAQMALQTAVMDQLASGARFTLILSARFETPASRKKIQACAASAGVPFLHVEARSTNIRAIRRLLQITGSTDPEAQLERYQALCEKYRPVDADEARRLPSLSLPKVLQDPDAAAAQVIARWTRIRG